jgi:hypothetical protein
MDLPARERGLAEKVGFPYTPWKNWRMMSIQPADGNGWFVAGRCDAG